MDVRSELVESSNSTSASAFALSVSGLAWNLMEDIFSSIVLR